MSENIRKFLESISEEDKAFYEKLDHMGKDELIQLAADMAKASTDA